MSNFIKKQYYKNLILGTGTGQIINAGVLFAMALGVDLYEGNRILTLLPAFILTIIFNCIGQSVRDNWQYKTTGEKVDVWEVYYMGFAAIPSIILSYVVLKLLPTYSIAGVAGIISILGLLIILIAFRLHRGEWFKFT